MVVCSKLMKQSAQIKNFVKQKFIPLIPNSGEVAKRVHKMTMSYLHGKTKGLHKENSGVDW